jgi:hypothetical protein
MRLTIATTLLVLFAPLALAQQLTNEELTRGLLNVATMRQLAAALDYQRAAHGSIQLGSNEAETAGLLAVDLAQLRDPWGTPYRIELLEKGGYRIAGAGSDRAFQESTWGTRAETTSLAADCVLAGGAFVRSNRQWLASLLTEEQKSDHSLATVFPRGDVYRIANTPENAWAWLRINEIFGDAIARNDPAVVGMMRERITQEKIKALAQQMAASRNARGVRGQRVLDEWGNALAVAYLDAQAQHVRIVSAGADKMFDQASWSKPITASPNDDLVLDDMSWTRAHDLDALAKAILPPDLQARPGRTKLKTTTGQQIYKVGGEVAAPVLLVRGEVPYPPELDGGRKIGMADVTIDANGKVLDVKPLLGLSAAADKMIAEAVSRWEFKPATRAGQPVAVIYSVTLSLAPPR